MRKRLAVLTMSAMLALGAVAPAVADAHRYNSCSHTSHTNSGYRIWFHGHYSSYSGIPGHWHKWFHNSYSPPWRYDAHYYWTYCGR